MSSFKSNDEGFTGLEAAIVLIAFVVVAAVFSYVVLGAGFFTTQKAQQTVHTSVDQSSSTLEIVGNVYGTSSAGGQAGSTITFVNFSMGLAPGGTPIDFTKVVMVYSNSSTLETLTNEGQTTNAIAEPTADSGEWAVTSIQNDPTGAGTLLLQPNEQFTISCAPTQEIAPNDQFTIEVRPSVGAAFSITRTAPALVNTVNTLY
jgi:flagellin FlaB